MRIVQKRRASGEPLVCPGARQYAQKQGVRAVYVCAILRLAILCKRDIILLFPRGE